MKLKRLAGGGIIAILSGSAYAHDLSERYGGLLGALLHPLTALDHALAFGALGLYAGLQGLRSAYRIVIAFNLALLIGVLLPTLTATGVFTSLGMVNITSVVVLGALTALAVRLPISVAMALAVFFGLSHGLENGNDLSGVGWPSAFGVFLAGITLTVPTAALAARLSSGYPRVAVRVAGSWIAAIGLMILGLQLRQA